jgi:hypothetical protein
LEYSCFYPAVNRNFGNSEIIIHELTRNGAPGAATKRPRAEKSSLRAGAYERGRFHFGEQICDVDVAGDVTGGAVTTPSAAV